MYRCFLTLVMAALALPVSWAQGAANDLLAGKLVDPEVGQWAWYDLTAPAARQQFVIRQAIVGEEKIGRKTGYWVEVEITPEAGFKTIYKMLLTGPASDLANVHRVVMKEGNETPREIPVDKTAAPEDKKLRSIRKSLGLEEVQTLSGPVQAEHIEVQEGDRTVHLWVNEAIKPTGIVKLRTTDGEMTLRNCGTGGDNAKSAINEQPVRPTEKPVETAPEPTVTVK